MTSTTIEPVATKRTSPKLRSARQQATCRLTNTTTASKSKSKLLQDQPAGDAQVMTQALLLRLLNRPDGTAIPEMMQATGRQKHRVRGFLSRTVKKKFVQPLTSPIDWRGSPAPDRSISSRTVNRSAVMPLAFARELAAERTEVFPTFEIGVGFSRGHSQEK